LNTIKEPAKFALRPYQAQLKADIYSAWTRCRFVLAVLPTGGGKTITFADIIHDHEGAVCAIAHRQELVSQISLALARDGIRHKIIGPKDVVKLCVNVHMMELGRSYYDPNAAVAVAGVNTIVSRKKKLANWGKTVTLWVQDECHHVLKENLWGKASALFPNAKGLGVTATPLRADGKGLGSESDGIFNELVEGPEMRWLINEGFLTDYRIFAPPSNFERPDDVGASGDFSRTSMASAVQKSRVMGDVVEHYLRLASGKLGVTFVPDVATAELVASQFNDRGVPAAVVHAKTPTAERFRILRSFKNRELMQLVNVDLFGEGFDLPAIEVVSFARPTESYGLFVQQFGRVLRLLAGKEWAIIIDHVGNVLRHGLPDSPRAWSLLGRNKKQSKQEDMIPVKACPECTSVYERFHKACPFCGFQSLPMSRSSPSAVDGDLEEMDAALLAQLRGDIAKVDQTLEDYRLALAARHVPLIGQMGHVNRLAAQQAGQAALREQIALWAGHQRALSRADSESYRRFFFKFGIDVMSAQALKTTDAQLLQEKIVKDIDSLVNTA